MTITLQAQQIVGRNVVKLREFCQDVQWERNMASLILADHHSGSVDDASDLVLPEFGLSA
jgi:hypothetical protein